MDGESRFRGFFSVGGALARIVALAVVLCAMATVVSSKWGAWWPYELVTHFPVQYLIVLVLGALVFMMRRRYIWAVVSLAFAVPNFMLVLPLYTAPRPSTPVTLRLKAVVMNVSLANREFEKAARFVRSCDPDLLVLEELDQDWLDNMRRSLPGYPHRVSRPREDRFGIALFSKIPIQDVTFPKLGTFALPSIRGSILVQGKRLTIFAVHPPPPICRTLSGERNRIVGRLADLALLATKEGAVMVMGDLNMTPWSPVFRRLLETAGLKECRTGFGLVPTWPAMLPPLLIPIDHVLLSKDLVAVRVSTGPDIGSDHYPLLVELGFR